MTTTGPLPLPDLDWRDGTPAATGFDDIYFNPEDGIAETRHVFLSGTGLPERWKGARHFAIGELGFGTGLNFLCAWELWNRTCPAGGHLHFVSAEGRPLSLDQLVRAHDRFPALADLSAALRAAYPRRARGHHLLQLAHNVTLHLLFGDAEDMLAGLEGHMDAWFLDGFAPSKNPAMWTEDIAAHVARCSAPGARLATFTVAGSVRRAFASAGFTLEKTPGFGRKREMLQGVLEVPPDADPAPWFAMPGPSVPERIAVIGGGIAGAASAQALARYGCRVTVIDAAAAPGSGGSGTPSGLVMPRLGAAADPPARFYAAAHRYAANTYQALSALTVGGALHLPPKPEQEARLAKTLETGLFDPERVSLLSAVDASALAGTAVTYPAIHFADAGRLQMKTYLSAALAKAEMRLGVQVERLVRAETDWHLCDGNGQVVLKADVVVIACALTAAKLLPQAQWLLEARAGQVTKARGGALALPVAYGGYAAPDGDGLWIGATHTRMNPDAAPAIDEHADQTNLTLLASVMPELAHELRVTGHWCGMRATTPDRLPIAGPVVDAAHFQGVYAPLGQGQTAGLSPAEYLPGLYAVTGLGSRGFASAPLLGELLASQILGLPSPVDREVRHMLHPARFTLRRIKRGTVDA